MSAPEGKRLRTVSVCARHQQQQHKEKRLRLRGERGRKKTSFHSGVGGSGPLRGGVKCASNAAAVAASAGTRSAASRVVRDGRLGSNCLE